MPCSSRVARREGFTLIEVLLVIGIIACLMAILIPSISRVQQQARTLNCISSQRDLILATLAYTQDFNQTMPFANWRSLETGKTPPAGWLYTYQGVQSFSEDDLRRGVLWRYLKSPRAWRCPSDYGPWNAGTTQTITSYLCNGAFCGFGGRAYFKRVLFKPTCVVYWELNAFNGGAGNDGSSFPSEPITDRHLGAGTVSFLDGHVEVWTQAQYNDELSRSPGKLWCAPDTANGH